MRKRPTKQSTAAFEPNLGDGQQQIGARNGLLITIDESQSAVVSIY